MNDEGGIAVALSDLRGAVNEGFAKLDGRLDMALQRTDMIERETMELKRRVEQLEGKVWKFSIAAAALGTGGATGIIQLIQGG